MTVIEEVIDNTRNVLEINESEKADITTAALCRAVSWAASIFGWRTAMKWQ